MKFYSCSFIKKILIFDDLNITVKSSIAHLSLDSLFFEQQNHTSKAKTELYAIKHNSDAFAKSQIKTSLYQYFIQTDICFE